MIRRLSQGLQTLAEVLIREIERFTRLSVARCHNWVQQPQTLDKPLIKRALSASELVQALPVPPAD